MSSDALVTTCERERHSVAGDAQSRAAGTATSRKGTARPIGGLYHSQTHARTHARAHARKGRRPSTHARTRTQAQAGTIASSMRGCSRTRVLGQRCASPAALMREARWPLWMSTDAPGSARWKIASTHLHRRSARSCLHPACSMQHARKRACTRAPCACDVEACGCEATEIGDGRRRDRWVVAEDVKERKILRLQPRPVTQWGSASARRLGGQCALSTRNVDRTHYEHERVRAVDTALTPKSKSRSTCVGGTHRVTMARRYSSHGTQSDSGGRGRCRVRRSGLAWPGGHLRVVVLRNRLAHRLEDAQRLQCSEATP